MPRASQLPTLLLLSLLVAACGGEGPDRTPPVDPIEVVVDVQIEPTVVTLDVGETFTLAALVTTETTEPAAAPAAITDVTWASMPAHVATVAADGTVVALAPGLALVSATAGGITGDAIITVREPVEPPPPVVVDVRIEPTAVTLDVGETFTLAALVTTETTEPAAAPAAVTDVTWASLSAHVATVAADGTVVALAPGAALVTATAGGITGEAIVTVREPAEPPPPPPAVDRVELSLTALALAEGEVATLTATPRDAGGAAIPGLAVQWRSADEGIVTVTAGGVLRGIRAGAADVSATVHGKAATARVTVTLETSFDLFFEAWSADTSRFFWLTRDLRDPAAANLVLLAGSTIAAAPVPSPAGDRVAFTLSVPLRPQNQLRVVDLQRDTLWFVELPGEVADAAWSADGGRIAFAVRSAETGFDIWTIGADGTGAVNLTGGLGLGNETQPTWAPAAMGKLAFTRNAGGRSDIWTVDADGANAARLTDGGADADPAWSPDGTSIAFQRSGAAIFGDLFFVSPAGAVQRSLVGLPGIQGRPAWSPDGALVAFTSGSDAYTMRAADGVVARRTFDGEATVEQRPGWLRRR